MAHWRQIVALGVCLAAVAAATGWADAPGAQQRPNAAQGPTIGANPAPNAEQIRILINRAIENQHRDDQALDEYERVEHIVTHKGENGDVDTDITQRVMPSPTGNIKLKTLDKGVAVPGDQYRQELEFAFNSFNLAMHPTDHYKEDLAKFDKRRHDHAELVDTSTKAFRLTWAGRETRTDSAGARTFMKFLLDPDPDYKPINRFATSFQHIHATLWVDEAQAQFARLEADIATDIPFAGGVAGKVYHGGHVTIVQEEVAPGIWLPTLFNYEVDGRKFLFAFGIHERTDISRYRRIGPPPQAIEIVRNELNNLSAATPAR
jgi:hypothetical protein